VHLVLCLAVISLLLMALSGLIAIQTTGSSIEDAGEPTVDLTVIYQSTLRRFPRQPGLVDDGLRQRCRDERG
jgi:hypothetical protein